MSGQGRHFLVVGAGPIAERHIGILQHLVPSASFTVWRNRPVQCGRFHTVNTLEDALARRPDAAIVASPASHHVAAAMALAEEGIDLFVEKPLSVSLDGVERLIERCEAADVLLQVGYCLRFSAGFAALARIIDEGRLGRLLHVDASVGQYLPDWRPGRDYRLGVSAQAALGGGAALELSHEFDYVRKLLGRPRNVAARALHSGTLDIDVEDGLDAIVEFAGGALASIHVDMLSRHVERRCRIVGVEGTAEWDLRADTLRVFRGAGGWEMVAEGAPIANMYQSQMRHFLDCLDNGGVPAVSGRDGADTLALTLAAKRAAAERQTVLL
jgi:predicted dehydrogenase